MKLFILFVGFLTISVGCSKDTNNLGSDFEKLVGTWRNIEGDYKMTVSIFENGEIEIRRSVERGIKFYATKLFKKNGTETDGWQAYQIEGALNYREDTNLPLKLNSSGDTIIFYTGSEINEQEHQVDYETKYVK